MALTIGRLIDNDFMNASAWDPAPPDATYDEIVIESMKVTVDTNVNQSALNIQSIRFAPELGAALKSGVQLGTPAAPLRFGTVSDFAVVQVPSSFVAIAFQCTSVPILDVLDVGNPTDGLTLVAGTYTKLLARRARGLRLTAPTITDAYLEFLDNAAQDVRAIVDAGATITNWYQDGGEAEISCAVTTLIDVQGGILRLKGSSKNQATVKVSGRSERDGVIEDWCNGGTRTLVVARRGGTYDAEVNPYTRTFTNCEAYPGACVKTNNGANVHTNALKNYGASKVSVAGASLNNIVKVPLR